MNGRTIPDPGWGYESLEAMIKGSAPIDYLAIMLGTNDILLTAHPDWRRTADDMRSLVRYIKEGMDEGRFQPRQDRSFEIILMIPPIVFPGSGLTDPLRHYEKQSKDLAEAYKKIAAEEGLLMIDVASWYVELAFDGVHISESGSIDMARRMEAALAEIIGGF